MAKITTQIWPFVVSLCVSFSIIWAMVKLSGFAPISWWAVVFPIPVGAANLLVLFLFESLADRLD